MSDKINDGGSAFPFSIPELNAGGQDGMSLRDYFAASALQGFCANHKALTENVKQWEEFSADDATIPRNMLALTCYMLADAMLKVRSGS